jgi:hypothetical protein
MKVQYIASDWRDYDRSTKSVRPEDNPPEGYTPEDMEESTDG